MNSQGEILGEVVGGHDGLADFRQEIIEHKIVALRYMDGFWGSLGLTGWFELKI